MKYKFNLTTIFVIISNNLFDIKFHEYFWCKKKILLNERIKGKEKECKAAGKYTMFLLFVQLRISSFFLFRFFYDPPFGKFYVLGKCAFSDNKSGIWPPNASKIEQRLFTTRNSYFSGFFCRLNHAKKNDGKSHLFLLLSSINCCSSDMFCLNLFDFTN